MPPYPPPTVEVEPKIEAAPLVPRPSIPPTNTPRWPPPPTARVNAVPGVTDEFASVRSPPAPPPPPDQPVLSLPAPPPPPPATTSASILVTPEGTVHPPLEVM